MRLVLVGIVVLLVAIVFYGCGINRLLK